MCGLLFLDQLLPPEVFISELFYQVVKKKLDQTPVCKISVKFSIRDSSVTLTMIHDWISECFLIDIIMYFHVGDFLHCSLL